MADVFISYARSTEDQAQKIAKALRALGYHVWRDDDLPAHRDYTTVIEEHLHAAKAVVVAWSAEAVKSRWVCAEADVAHEAGVLIQLSLDGATPPLPFNRIQCADMNGWSGEDDAPGWRKVVRSVAELVGPDTAAETAAAAVAAAAAAAPGRPLTGAAARWAVISDSLDPDDYDDFLHVFTQSEEAFEARRQKRRLEAWANTDKTNLPLVLAFLKMGSFPALHAIVQAAASDLAAQRLAQPPVPDTAPDEFPPPAAEPQPTAEAAAPVAAAEPEPAAEAVVAAAAEPAAEAVVAAALPPAAEGIVAPTPEPPAEALAAAPPEPAVEAVPAAMPEPVVAAAPEPAVEAVAAVVPEAAIEAASVAAAAEPAAAPAEPAAELAAASEPAPIPEPQAAAVPAAEPAPMPEPRAVAAAASEPALSRPAARAPARRGPPWLMIGGAVAVVGVIAVGGVVLMSGGKAPQAARPSAAAAPGAPTATATATPAAPPPPSLQPVAQDADALVADAQRFGRPETSTLTAADASLKALVAQIVAAPAASRPALLAQLDTQAAGMAGTEATTLSRSAAGQLQSAERTLSGADTPGAGEALEALRNAASGVSQAAAATSHAAGADASLQAARQTLAAYGAFAAADAAATRLFAPAHRAEFAQVSAEAHTLAGQVVALGNASRPWLFASQAKKQAWQLLQTNSTSAKAEIARLDALAPSVASASDAEVERAISEASSVKETLSGLYASSTAAQAVH